MAPASAALFALSRASRPRFWQRVRHSDDGMSGEGATLSILMTDMPGMKMTAPMSIGKVTSSVAADGKTLVGKLQSPLPAGTYKLGWHAVTADTHRVKGSYSFVVK